METSSKSRLSYEPYDVIVLGAGISALATAHQILSDKPGASVLLLEARSRCGGRINTHQLGSKASSNKVDLGASFVHGTIGNPLVELSKKASFTLHLPPEDAVTEMYEFSGRRLPPEDAERLSYLSHSIIFEKLQSQSQKSDSIPPSASVFSALEDAVDELEIWEGLDISERSAVENISHGWSGWTGAVLDKVSLKFWGFEQEYPGPDAVVKEGYGTLVDYYRTEIQQMGGQIALNTVVEDVSKKEEDNLIAINGTLNSKYVVCSLPLGVLKHSTDMFHPSLPPRRLSSLKRLGMGLLNKLVLQYPTHWWSSDESDNWMMLLASPGYAGLLDDLRHNRKIPPAMEKRIQRLILRLCPIMVQDYYAITRQNVLVAFLGPPAAEVVELMSPEEASEIIHSRLISTVARAKGIERVDKPSQIIATGWQSDPFSRGSYSYLPRASSEYEDDGATPLDFMECGHPLWDGKLGWVGEHTDPDCYASVHGALLSGRKEGKRVAALLNA